MITRRKFVLALGSGVLTTPFIAGAQQARKLARIGYLSVTTVEADRRWLAAFRDELRKLGYVEGQSILVEQRHAAGQPARFAELTAELVGLNVDVLVVYGAAAGVLVVKKATSTIPIVFTVVSDPVKEGVVASLARPGGNVTGLSDLHGGVVTKRLELLKEMVPSVSRVAVLSNAANPGHPLQLKDIEAAAPSVGVAVLSLPVTGPDDIDRAFSTMRKERSEGLIVLGDPILGTHRRKIVNLAIKNRMPAIFTTREAAEAGGLLSYGTIFPELWRRAATYVDKILKGAKPGDLPIEQATKFEMVVNLKTARAIGVSVPRSVLLRADHVIE